MCGYVFFLFNTEYAETMCMTIVVGDEALGWAIVPVFDDRRVVARLYAVEINFCGRGERERPPDTFMHSNFPMQG